MTSASLRFVAVALMLGATALLLQARSGNEVSPPREPLTSLPDHFGPWVGQDLPIDQQTRDILGAGEFLQRNFVNSAQPQPWVDLFIAYFPARKLETPFTRRTTACREKDGFRFSAKLFSSPALTDHFSPRIAS